MSRVILNVLKRARIHSIFHKSNEVPLQALPGLWQDRSFYVCPNVFQSEETKAGAAAKKLKLAIKVTLLGKNDSITVTTLEEAQKLARRRQLNLVKVQDVDSKTQRPVYKLVSQAELLAEEVLEVSSPDKEKSIKRTEKLLTIGSRIADHDLKSRLKHIEKWLSKGHEVRVLIQGVPTDDSAERIFTNIQNFVKNIGRVVQKRVKNSNIKFSILPPSEKQS